MASYSIAQLAADLGRICAKTRDEQEILDQGRPLARRAALASKSWLMPYMYQVDSEQGFGVHLLHEQANHTLAIFAVSWLPGRGTPPHDHGTWALIASVDGPEMNQFFDRVDSKVRPGYAVLKDAGEKVFDIGEVVAMPSGAIHSVRNKTDKVTLSLHIYGKHINFTGRSQFDPKHQTETPFILKVAQK